MRTSAYSTGSTAETLTISEHPADATVTTSDWTEHKTADHFGETTRQSKCTQEREDSCSYYDYEYDETSEDSTTDSEDDTPEYVRQHDLLRVKGFVNGHPADILIDP